MGTLQSNEYGEKFLPDEPQREVIVTRNKGDKFNINQGQQPEYVYTKDQSAPIQRLSIDSPDMAKKSESDTTGYF